MHQSDLIERDIDAYLAQHERKELLRFITCGSVDDGKSTLIGRLLHDTHLIYEDTLATIRKDSAKVGTTGKGNIDLALLVDGLQAEREQGITIDVAHRYFSTERRKFIIADTPGHEQYTRNMATGASTCDLAIILIDARHGVLVQTRRHSFIVSLLGIKHVVIAINKMDLVNFSQDRFNEIREQYLAFAAPLSFPDVKFLPISALNGDNVVDASQHMSWHTGGTLIQHLENVEIGNDRNFTDFRFPVQLVSRPNLNYRGYAGTIASGSIRVGDEVISVPNGARTRVKSIDTFDGQLQEAFTPMAVTLTLESEIDLSRGEMLARPDNVPHVGRDFEAMLVWMNADAMVPGKQYMFKIGTNVVTGNISTLRNGVDVNTLTQIEAARLDLNQVGRVHVSLNRAVPFDPYVRNRGTGCFVVIDRVTNVTVGAGMVIDLLRAEDLTLGHRKGAVTAEERAERLRQRPMAVVVSGNAELVNHVAESLERRLFDGGATAFRMPAGALAGRDPIPVIELLMSAGLVIIAALTTEHAVQLSAKVGPERVLDVRAEGDLTRVVDAAVRSLEQRRAI